MKRSLFHLSVVFILISLMIFVSGCTNKKAEIRKNALLKTENAYQESKLYDDAMLELKKNNFKEAIKNFEKVNDLYPFSYLGKRSQMMAAFASYQKKDYLESELFAGSYINLYPCGEDIEYVYYLAGLASFARVQSIENDIKPVFIAREYFNKLIDRFPKSEYIEQSQRKLFEIKEIIAAKNLDIAVFYLKNIQYSAAIERLRKITADDYLGVKFYPEALYRIIEAYKALGIIDDAKVEYSILKKKFPDSKWRSYADDIMK